MLPVWVAARDIPKGHVIAPEDLLEKSLDASRLQRGFTHSSQPLAGSKSLRHLRMGQLIGELDLQQAWAVRAGEGVLIRVGQPGFSATTRGTALSNGAIGEGVRVRNLSSGKEIQAWVVDKGKSKPAFSAEMASLIQVRPPQGRLSQKRPPGIHVMKITRTDPVYVQPQSQRKAGATPAPQPQASQGKPGSAPPPRPSIRRGSSWPPPLMWTWRRSTRSARPSARVGSNWTWMP